MARTVYSAAAVAQQSAGPAPALAQGAPRDGAAGPAAAPVAHTRKDGRPALHGHAPQHHGQRLQAVNQQLQFCECICLGQRSIFGTHGR